MAKKQKLDKLWDFRVNVQFLKYACRKRQEVKNNYIYLLKGNFYTRNKKIAFVRFSTHTKRI